MIGGEGDPMNRRLQEQSAEKLSRYLGDERADEDESLYPAWQCDHI